MAGIRLSPNGWCNRCQKYFEVKYCDTVSNQGGKRHYKACPECSLGLVQRVEKGDR